MGRCNRCGGELGGAGARATVTRCLHQLCPACAGEARGGGQCPACGEALAPADLREVPLQRDPRDADLALLGQTADFALSACLAAFRFEEHQMYLEMQSAQGEQAKALEAHHAEVEGKYRSKLEEVYSGYQQYRGKCKKLTEERDALAQDQRELQEKYAEKTAVVRKLQEKCHHQHEELKRLGRGQPARPPTPTSQAHQQQQQQQQLVPRTASTFRHQGPGDGAANCFGRSAPAGLQAALPGGTGTMGFESSYARVQFQASPRSERERQQSPYFPAQPKLNWQHNSPRSGGGGLGVPHEAFPMHGGAGALPIPGLFQMGAVACPVMASPGDRRRRSSQTFQAAPSNSYLSV